MGNGANTRPRRSRKLPRPLTLMRAMDEVDYSPYCPHGCPVLVRLNRAEIERRFERA